MIEEKKNEAEEEFEVTVDSNIMEVVEKIPGAAAIFADYGLPCAGCAAASYESISDIVAEFGVDGDELVSAIKKSNDKELSSGLKRESC